tara:strand:+ start:1800 stop:2822 length:1023 start_codon:yes stop_codon:yes gene_type:complete
MKLFQRLLVAPAALGLLAPVAANADIAFSPTTTLSGVAVFTTGTVADGGTADTQDALYMQYAYGLDITSSFTGQDLLYTGIEAGNASGPLANLDNTSDGGDNLKVTSLFYEFPVGDHLSVTTGPLLDQDDVVAATVSSYAGAFRIGGMPFSLAGDETGPGLGLSYSADNGVVASASYVSVGGTNSTQGIGGDTGDDVTTLTLGYDGEGFGGGIVVASNDGNDTTTTAGYDTFGAGIYYSPESFPATITLAYDSKDPEAGNNSTDWFLGMEYEVGPGLLSAAYNSTDVEGGSADDQTGLELAYSYAVNDHLTITPGFFSVEETTAGQSDDKGVFLETVFSF